MTKKIIEEKIEEKKLTKGQMISTIKKNIDNPNGLRNLLQLQPIMVIEAATYLNSREKIKLEKIIQEKVPDVKLPISEKARRDYLLEQEIEALGAMEWEDLIRYEVKKITERVKQNGKEKLGV